MQLVPVLDLQDGVVVHARPGPRRDYRPLISPRCGGPDPLDMVSGLLALGRFDILYCADLDAIQGTGDHRAVLRALRRRYPRLTLWVDAGLATADAVDAWLHNELGTPVLGSETLADASIIGHARRRLGDELVLSLDCRGEQVLGPSGFLAAAAEGPARLIVMAMDRVGSGDGPDLDALTRIRGQAPHATLYAAGGIRGPADLAAAARAGVTGALVASALHDGRLDPAACRAGGA